RDQRAAAGRRDQHGVPGGVPDRGDRVRRSVGQEQPRRQAAQRSPELRAGPRDVHQAAQSLPRARPQPALRSGEQACEARWSRMSTAEATAHEEAEKMRDAFKGITRDVSWVAENPKPHKAWLVLLAASTLMLLGGVYSGYVLVTTGVGVWGNSNTVCWAWDITNFVWWIGIGHAGTLI